MKKSKKLIFVRVFKCIFFFLCGNSIEGIKPRYLKKTCENLLCVDEHMQHIEIFCEAHQLTAPPVLYKVPWLYQMHIVDF